MNMTSEGEQVVWKSIKKGLEGDLDLDVDTLGRVKEMSQEIILSGPYRLIQRLQLLSE